MIFDLIKSYLGVSIIDHNGSFDFEDLRRQIRHYGDLLINEIQDGETVVIYSDYNFFSISLLLSLSSRLINVVPIVNTTDKEFEEKINSCYPQKIITVKDNGEIDISLNSTQGLEKLDDVYSKGDTGIILFSSGTTGKPKVMIQNFSELIRNIPTPRRQKSLVFILFLMFDHIGGLNTLLNCLVNGSTIVIPKDRNPSTIIESIEKHHVNVLPTSPTFLNLMLMDQSFDPDKLKSLRLITYGTERMPNHLLRRLNELLPKIKFLQTFGTSETGILKTISKSSDSLYFKISDPDKEHKIIDGELYLRSKTSIKGYKNHDNSSFKEDGWFATGDLVEQDEEGFIKIVGRKNKVINVGGLKVLPSEIEEIINSVAGVIDSTVYGEKNEITGNIVCSDVFINDGNIDHNDLKKTIKRTCRNQLDKYKIPVRINVKLKLEINKRGKKK